MGHLTHWYFELSAALKTLFVLRLFLCCCPVSSNSSSLTNSRALLYICTLPVVSGLFLHTFSTHIFVWVKIKFLLSSYRFFSYVIHIRLYQAVKETLVLSRVAQIKCDMWKERGVLYDWKHTGNSQGYSIPARR